MSDFYQTGVVATIHRLGTRPLDSLEKDLREFGRSQPIALVLPALYSEFQTEAMPRILEEVARVPYLTEVVLTLGQANAEQFAEACRRVAGLHPHVRIVWNDGPRIQKLYRELQAADLLV